MEKIYKRNILGHSILVSSFRAVRLGFSPDQQTTTRLLVFLYIDNEQASLLGQMTQVLVLGFNWWAEKHYYRRNNLLVIGGTRTQALRDDHCCEHARP